MEVEVEVEVVVEVEEDREAVNRVKEDILFEVRLRYWGSFDYNARGL